MLSKNQIKFINSLKQKKYRDEEGLFIAEGVKIVSELLNSSIKIKEIYAVKKYIENLSTKGHAQLYEVSEIELKKISSLTTPNQVIAIAEISKYDLQNEDISSKLSIALDDIQDPGNLGTIIRIADWFGIENIICSGNSVDVYNPKVVQATMGSIARVKVHHTSLNDFLAIFSRDFKIYGTILSGENIYHQKLSNKGIILLGNESKGISEKLLSYVTDKVSIPSFGKKPKNADSLNVAIAAAVICSEFRKNILIEV
jgi:TrmH family RNA methyltransferase